MLKLSFPVLVIVLVAYLRCLIALLTYEAYLRKSLIAAIV